MKNTKNKFNWYNFVTVNFFALNVPDFMRFYFILLPSPDKLFINSILLSKDKIVFIVGKCGLLLLVKHVINNLDCFAASLEILLNYEIYRLK